MTRFDAGHSKHHCFRTSGDPRDYRFIQINARDWKNFVVVDVDQPDAFERLVYPGIPRPHWIICNPDNGHAQAGWMIETVFCGKNARYRPMTFYRAVSAALTNAVGGDHAFTCHIVRNPMASEPSGPVYFSDRTEPWSLNELKSHLCTWRDPGLKALGYEDEQPDLWNPYPPNQHRYQRALSAGHSPAEGRNCYVFYTTRARLWKLHDAGREIRTASYTIAHELNRSLPQPLGRREVDQIAASAIRQVHKGNGRRSALNGQPADPWLSRLGTAGGRARTAPKVAAARHNLDLARTARSDQARKRAKEALRLRRRGEVISAIARAQGVSPRTIKRYLAMARAEALNRVLAGGDTHQASGECAAPKKSELRLPTGFPLLRVLVELRRLSLRDSPKPAPPAGNNPDLM